MVAHERKKESLQEFSLIAFIVPSVWQCTASMWTSRYGAGAGILQRSPHGGPPARHTRRRYGKIATTRLHPALPRVSLTGKQATVKPNGAGSARKLASFSM